MQILDFYSNFLTVSYCLGTFGRKQMTASKRVLRILISVNLPTSLKFGFKLDRYVVVAFLLRSCLGAW